MKYLASLAFTAALFGQTPTSIPLAQITAPSSPANTISFIVVTSAGGFIVAQAPNCTLNTSVTPPAVTCAATTSATPQRPERQVATRQTDGTWAIISPRIGPGSVIQVRRNGVENDEGDFAMTISNGTASIRPTGPAWMATEKVVCWIY